MPVRALPSRAPILAIVLAAAVAGTVAGCSHILPIGPDAGPSMPPPRHLGSPIIVQVMRSRSHSPTSGCPAGWLEVFLAPSLLPHASSVHAVQVSGQPGTSGRSEPSRTTPTPAPAAAPPSPLPCYQPVGTPVTITSAAVSTVLPYPVPRGQPKGPAPYGFTVAVPGANVAAVTALITQAYDAGDALGISVAGRLWEAPQVRSAFSGQRLEIAVFTKNQALKLYRLLIPSR
jgi:hypothetical protein